jgi:2-keto-4-pentenoate hydratase/2-oxohepta-3-ene-1,7-dioic acid hydratase in catechol pathway
MRLVTFQRGSQGPAAGAFINGDADIVDLAAAHQLAHGSASPHLASVLAIVEAGDNGLDVAAEAVKRAAKEAVVPRGDVRLRAPIHPPPQMRDCMCFEKHLRQSNAATWTLFERRAEAAGRPKPERGPTADMALNRFLRQPVYYKSNRFAVIGPEDDVIWPAFSKMMDYELEFGVYIKGPVKNVPVEKARDAIFGYTIFNDMSARDTQMIEMTGMLGPSKSKDFDTANPMGPCLVTADEIPDPYNLTMVVRVNGEERGRGNSGDMRWKFEDLIAAISAEETLYAGEFLGSGTVGDGCGLEHLRFLEPGDLIELEVEGIGVLRNRIVKPAA